MRALLSSRFRGVGGSVEGLTHVTTAVRYIRPSKGRSGAGAAQAHGGDEPTSQTPVSVQSSSTPTGPSASGPDAQVVLEQHKQALAALVRRTTDLQARVGAMEEAERTRSEQLYKVRTAAFRIADDVRLTRVFMRQLLLETQLIAARVLVVGEHAARLDRELQTALLPNPLDPAAAAQVQARYAQLVAELMPQVSKAVAASADGVRGHKHSGGGQLQHSAVPPATPFTGPSSIAAGDLSFFNPPGAGSLRAALPAGLTRADTVGAGFEAINELTEMLRAHKARVLSRRTASDGGVGEQGADRGAGGANTAAQRLRSIGEAPDADAELSVGAVRSTAAAPSASAADMVASLQTQFRGLWRLCGLVQREDQAHVRRLKRMLRRLTASAGTAGTADTEDPMVDKRALRHRRRELTASLRRREALLTMLEEVVRPGRPAAVEEESRLLVSVAGPEADLVERLVAVVQAPTVVTGSLDASAAAAIKPVAARLREEAPPPVPPAESPVPRARTPPDARSPPAAPTTSRPASTAPTSASDSIAAAMAKALSKQHPSQHGVAPQPPAAAAKGDTPPPAGNRPAGPPSPSLPVPRPLPAVAPSTRAPSRPADAARTTPPPPPASANPKPTLVPAGAMAPTRRVLARHIPDAVTPFVLRRVLARSGVAGVSTVLATSAPLESASGTSSTTSGFSLSAAAAAAFGTPLDGAAVIAFETAADAHAFVERCNGTQVRLAPAASSGSASSQPTVTALGSSDTATSPPPVRDGEGSSSGGASLIDSVAMSDVTARHLPPFTWHLSFMS